MRLRQNEAGPVLLRRAEAGFTLIEVLLSLAVFSIGMMMIFPSYFKSSELLAHLSRRYEANLIVNNLLVESEINFRKAQDGRPPASAGSIRLNENDYQYRMRLVPQDKAGGLYRLTAEIEWRDRKQNRFSRSAVITK